MYEEKSAKRTRNKINKKASTDNNRGKIIRKFSQWKDRNLLEAVFRYGYGVRHGRL
jgi:hypothetical protein